MEATVIRANLRKRYQGLSRQELLDRAYELGFDYEQYSQSCSQSVIAAFHELFEMDDAIVRVATSSCGGQAVQILGTCGALIGGTMALDYFFGRPAENMSRQETTRANLEALMVPLQTAKSLTDRYIKEYGTIICPHIQMQLFGRHYYILDPDEMGKFEEAGGHKDKCTRVTGNAARWVMEILIDKGVVEPQPQA